MPPVSSSMPLPLPILRDILQDLRKCGSSASDFIISLLQCREPDVVAEVQLIADGFDGIMDEALKNPECTEVVCSWASKFIADECSDEIQTLVKDKSSLQIKAAEISLEKIQDLAIDKIGQIMQQLTPNTWKLLDMLLNADKRSNYYRRTRSNALKQGQRQRERGGDRNKSDSHKDLDEDTEFEDLDDEDMPEDRYATKSRVLLAG